MKASASSKIDISTPEKPARSVRRKGKKSVSFQDDPEILKRLGRVAEMMLEGKSLYEISTAQRCSIATAKRDIGRVRELWRNEAKGRLDYLASEAIAQYTKVKAVAWEKVTADPSRADRYLAIVLSAQEKIDRLTGAVEPEGINLNVAVSGQVELKDMDEVRERRWDGVRAQLKQIVAGKA